MCSFLDSLSSAHFYHENRDVAVESLQIFSLDPNVDLIRVAWDKLASDVNTCNECCDVYYGIVFSLLCLDAKDTFFELYIPHYERKDMDAL